MDLKCLTARGRKSQAREVSFYRNDYECTDLLIYICSVHVTGYKYFGAAKDLPGVRELFEPEISHIPKKTRGELMRDVDADYYGYRDDDDGMLEPLEREAEAAAIEKLEAEWVEKRKSKGKSVPDFQALEAEKAKMEEEIKNYFIQVPSQKEMEQKIIDLKKKMLLEQYVSPEITNKEAEAKELLGIN